MPQARVIPFLEVQGPRPARAGRPDLIVQIGRDQELCRLRGRVISSAGFLVRSITPEEIVLELERTHCSVVWVFCHTLESYENVLLAATIRRCRPTDKFLRLDGIHRPEPADGLFDQSLAASETVDSLLRVVASLARHPA